MPNRHVKRCSTSLIIREMQIETTKWDIISGLSERLSSKVYKYKNAGMMWRKGTLLLCWRECKLVQPLWKTVWKLLKNLKIALPYDPAIPLLGIYLDKTLIQKDTCIPMFIAALFTVECDIFTGESTSRVFKQASVLKSLPWSSVPACPGFLVCGLG